jgi:hypothetical protein
MISVTRLALTTIIALMASTVACSEGKQVTTKDVKSMIAAELPRGASAEAVEAFFQRHELPYSYDRFSRRYQSIIRDVSRTPGVDQAIVIYLYVDGEKRFTTAEVRDTFTAP